MGQKLHLGKKVLCLSLNQIHSKIRPGQMAGPSNMPFWIVYGSQSALGHPWPILDHTDYSLVRMGPVTPHILPLMTFIGSPLIDVTPFLWLSLLPSHNPSGPHLAMGEAWSGHP